MYETLQMVQRMYLIGLSNATHCTVRLEFSGNPSELRSRIAPVKSIAPLASTLNCRFTGFNGIGWTAVR